MDASLTFCKIRERCAMATAVPDSPHRQSLLLEAIDKDRETHGEAPISSEGATLVRVTATARPTVLTSN